MAWNQFCDGMPLPPLALRHTMYCMYLLVICTAIWKTCSNFNITNISQKKLNKNPSHLPPRKEMICFIYIYICSCFPLPPFPNISWIPPGTVCCRSISWSRESWMRADTNSMTWTDFAHFEGGKNAHTWVCVSPEWLWPTSKLAFYARIMEVKKMTPAAKNIKTANVSGVCSFLQGRCYLQSIERLTLSWGHRFKKDVRLESV